MIFYHAKALANPSSYAIYVKIYRYVMLCYVLSYVMLSSYMYYFIKHRG